MGAFSDYIESIKAGIEGQVPYGGTIVPTSNEFATGMSQFIKGGSMVLDTLETLADMPIALMEKDMSIVVSQHTRPNGSLHTRTRYYLKIVPADTIANLGEDISIYWTVETTSTAENSTDTEVQYAPNYNGKRPLFLPTEISSDAYQAGYPTDDAYIGGNPSDIIWSDSYVPTKNPAWIRQRITGQPWGIPVSIAAGGDYESNQYLDYIFRWVTKGSGTPDRPVQPNNYNELPSGWQDTPGNDYDTRILTQDLYRSQALRSPYGVLKSNWDIPILISSDPQLVRYGNTPGSTDFLNNTYWRGYYTPGFDTHMATRATNVDTVWNITKIDKENGEYVDFVFKLLPIGLTGSELLAETPTATIPIGQASPNDWTDGPIQNTTTDKIEYVSKCTKFSDGSLKTPWSTPRKFDGIDSFVATIDETPGDTFYQSRDASGNLVQAFTDLAMTAKLYKGITEVTTEITGYKWYRGATFIVFSPNTYKATNLGIGLNAYHTISPDGKTLTINPPAVDSTQQYKVGIAHTSSPSADYQETIQIKDATDDGNAFVVDIKQVNGSTFKNQTGLYRFDANFYKGGVFDSTNVTYVWSLKNGAGAEIAGGLRNVSGGSLSTPVTLPTVYVQGADVDQFATLTLVATFGSITRTDIITLTDVQDAEALEVLYWGLGSTDPGSPTDFTPRTLTQQQVLDLGIGYLLPEDAAGAWYRIERVGGIWGAELKVRGESARPNGGIQLIIFKNVTAPAVPAAPAVPGSGSIVPSGWTQAPTAFVGTEDTTYMTSCFFQLRTDFDGADPLVLTRDNYNPSGTYGTPIRIQSPGAGIDGFNGWSPIFASEAYGSKILLKLKAWTGGTGPVPPGADGATSYIGATGLTTKDLATDFKGDTGADSGYIPPFFVKSGSDDPNSLPLVSTSQGVESLLQTITLQAATNARIVMIKGRVKLRSDSLNNDDMFKIVLSKTIYDSSTGLPLSTTDVASSIYRPNVNDSNQWEWIRIDYSENVSAPAQKTAYITKITQIAGGSAYRNSGYLEALVINL